MGSNRPNMARKVWQRVCTPAEGQTLREMVGTLEQDAACVRRYQIPENAAYAGLLKQLEQGFTAQAAAFRGMLGLPRRPGGSLQDQEPELCFHHALERLGACNLRSGDPVYGAVFRIMASQTEQQCFLILQLLGCDLRRPQKNGRQK